MFFNLSVPVEYCLYKFEDGKQVDLLMIMWKWYEHIQMRRAQLYSMAIWSWNSLK